MVASSKKTNSWLRTVDSFNANKCTTFDLLTPKRMGLQDVSWHICTSGLVVGLTLTMDVRISARQSRSAFSSVYVGRWQLIANSRCTTSKSSANLRATVSTTALDVSVTDRRSSVTLAAASACVATITTRGFANSLPAKPSHRHNLTITAKQQPL